MALGLETCATQRGAPEKVAHDRGIDANASLLNFWETNNLAGMSYDRLSTVRILWQSYSGRRYTAHYGTN